MLIRENALCVTVIFTARTSASNHYSEEITGNEGMAVFPDFGNARYRTPRVQQTPHSINVKHSSLLPTSKRPLFALLHILRILARNLHVTRDSLSHRTLQMRGIVALHSLVQEEEEAETAQCPEERASRADRLNIEIDGRFGSDSVLPNQLGVLRKLPVTSFKPTIPTDFEGSFLCT